MYQTVKLTKKSTKISNPFTRSLRVVHGTIPTPVPYPSYGVDPGVNFGLTVIECDRVWVFNGILNQDEKPGRRGLIAYQFLNTMIPRFFTPSITYRLGTALMVIEGASYGDQYGQALLEEIRQSFYIAASLYAGFSDVIISPPKTIRKGVFGDGTIRAPDEFPTLNRNAADSLAMALFAAQYGKKGE